MLYAKLIIFRPYHCIGCTDLKKDIDLFFFHVSMQQVYFLNCQQYLIVRTALLCSYL